MGKLSPETNKRKKRNETNQGNQRGKPTRGRRKPEYTSWRQMYVRRPKLRFDGLYYQMWWPHPASTNLYCQYRAYYKYLRFYSDGSCYQYTTCDGPTEVMDFLHNIRDKNLKARRGDYYLQDNRVSIQFLNTKTNQLHQMKLWIQTNRNESSGSLCWFRSSKISPFIYCSANEYYSRSEGPL